MRLGDLHGGLAKALEKKDPEYTGDARSEERKHRRKNEASEKKKARTEKRETDRAVREEVKEAVRAAKGEKEAERDKPTDSSKENRAARPDPPASRNTTETGNVLRFLEKPTEAEPHLADPKPSREPEKKPAEKSDRPEARKEPADRSLGPRTDDVRRVMAAMTSDPRAAVKHRSLPDVDRKSARGSGDEPSRDRVRELPRELPRGKDVARSSRKTEEPRTRRAPAETQRDAGAPRRKTERRAFEVAAGQQQPKAEERGFDRVARKRKEIETTEADVGGCHARVDFDPAEDLRSFLDGLRETDALGHAHRCRGVLGDGTRCLRRPPEGELYCREHRVPGVTPEPPAVEIATRPTEPEPDVPVSAHIVTT